MKVVPLDIVAWMASNRNKSSKKPDVPLVAVSGLNAFSEVVDASFVRHLQSELAKLARLDWRPVAAGLPMADDADDCGDVEWSDGRDIWQGFWGSPKAQATHWRPIHLPTIPKQPEPLCNDYSFNC